MTCNVHICIIYIFTINNTCPKFILLRKHATWNSLCWKNTNYRSKSSGKRWAEVIHGILRDMKCLPSKADPCIWLRKAPNLRCYEYIAVYVDGLCIEAESPNAIIQIFKSKYHLKVKGDGKLTYHLGADYLEDPDGTFVSQPKKYIDNASMRTHQKAIRPLLTRMITQS